ncbi:unnamed protein product [Heligmosomoides polygyrus]|uniref:Type II toxin-antitoxin system prevent-host-death family antitoxin n=1 Tax=Heligmosomoides polygyrus TaxID=6339 RepID=A0A183FTM7_HELPZ|nr:unnamed protein product [Heligmosomoides polygyrus]
MCDTTYVVVVMHQLRSAVDRHNRGRGVNHRADSQRSLVSPAATVGGRALAGIRPDSRVVVVSESGAPVVAIASQTKMHDSRDWIDSIGLSTPQQLHGGKRCLSVAGSQILAFCRRAGGQSMTAGWTSR